MNDGKELLVIRPGNTIWCLNAKTNASYYDHCHHHRSWNQFCSQSLFIIPSKVWAVGMHSVLRLWIADITAKTVYIETAGISLGLYCRSPPACPCLEPWTGPNDNNEAFFFPGDLYTFSFSRCGFYFWGFSENFLSWGQIKDKKIKKKMQKKIKKMHVGLSVSESFKKSIYSIHQKFVIGTSLVVQWLRLSFHGRGHRLSLWLGNWDPTCWVVHPKIKKKKLSHSYHGL